MTQVTWNYRVVKVNTEHDSTWGIYEVYYDASGAPIARTEEPATFVSDDGPDELRRSLALAFDDAMSRPLLDDSEIGMSVHAD